jgi:adenylate cyclase
MATEIERKFLVRGEFRHLAVSRKEITQTYLSKDPFKTVRVRIAEEKAYLTIKSPVPHGSLARGEWDFEIPVADAAELMKICLPGKIIKTRYMVPSGRHIFEVDVFHDRNEGLIIAELELASENEKYIRPEWLGEEVTGNPAYYNSNLAR